MSDTRFILDVHLGKLARYLRLCGLDSSWRNDFTNGDIISFSISDHRIILTRDREILKNKKVTHGYWVRSQNPEDQLKEVINQFDLTSGANPFSRCLECNGIISKVSKDEIAGKLLPKTKKYFSEFRQCSGCGRIYWEGSHYDRMKKFVDELFLA